MKKILPIFLLAFVGLFLFSCDNNDNDNFVDSDTYSKMRDVTGSFTNANSYAFSQGINIQSTDVVLVYRSLGDAWQLIPKDQYIPNVTGMPTGRVFNYNYVFDSQEVQIRIDDPSFDLSTELTSSEKNQYLNNQKFRIVLVPASASKNANGVDTSDYNAVIKYYGLDDSKVPVTKAN
ncbi:hypothetical protein [Chryseobacterium oryctis]|uniref:Lipoprotein n=1 Tax=Chryseobacterium oryctis TaxID=2952618 RepID=A0ABT3HQD4_9FLAO|nr:hypothetical protein [Chryseobacterium oryctis]MCW3161992.1 hypothetical protein [Chryseobacterium oryctis]